MEGPYIKIESDRPESESSSGDAGFAEALSRMQESDPPLAGQLREINRSPEKKKIFTEALTLSGHNWLDLQDLRDNPEAASAFGRLISFWDMPVGDQPKSDKQHQAEVTEFATLLK